MCKRTRLLFFIFISRECLRWKIERNQANHSSIIKQIYTRRERSLHIVNVSHTNTFVQSNTDSSAYQSEDWTNEKKSSTIEHGMYYVHCGGTDTHEVRLFRILVRVAAAQPLPFDVVCRYRYRYCRIAISHIVPNQCNIYHYFTKKKITCLRLLYVLCLFSSLSRSSFPFRHVSTANGNYIITEKLIYKKMWRCLKL